MSPIYLLGDSRILQGGTGALLEKKSAPVPPCRILRNTGTEERADGDMAESGRTLYSSGLDVHLNFPLASAQGLGPPPFVRGAPKR